VGSGVLPTWKEASFRHHAKLELLYDDYKKLGRYTITAFLVVSPLSPPCAVGTMSLAEKPLLDTLREMTDATVLSSHVVESFVVETETSAQRGTSAESLQIQFGFDSTHWLAQHVVASLAKASEGLSQLSADELLLTGMIGVHTRHFLNIVAGGLAVARQSARLDSSTGGGSCGAEDGGNRVPNSGCNVMEVGVYMGASMCAAVLSNPGVRYLGVDDWSQFGGRVETMANARNCPPVGGGPITMVDGDCWVVAANLRAHARKLQGHRSAQEDRISLDVGCEGKASALGGITSVTSFEFPDTFEPIVNTTAVLEKDVIHRHAPVDVYHFDGAQRSICSNGHQVFTFAKKLVCMSPPRSSMLPFHLLSLCLLFVCCQGRTTRWTSGAAWSSSTSCGRVRGSWSSWMTSSDRMWSWPPASPSPSSRPPSAGRSPCAAPAATGPNKSRAEDARFATPMGYSCSGSARL
jgi:hypothetical protein